MQKFIKSYLNALLNLIFPNFCVLCQASLLKNEETICTVCENKLPYTNYHLIEDNLVEKKLWGRVPIRKGSSLLYFEKGLDVQKLISELKYNNREDVGSKLGDIYGNILLKVNSEFLKCDIIIPIPLHYKKEKRRGYNQCHEFTKSLSYKIEVPYSFKSIERTIDTISQTGKSRINRWENVSEIFKVVYPNIIKNKHILIVDDVMTTGATIEALANKILEIEGTKISVLLMASAM